MKYRFISVIMILITIAFILPNEVGAFVQQWEYSAYQPAGFLSGIWHGLLAPYSLIARWFMDSIDMYAIVNTGWVYDLGFLLGVGGSLPIGLIAVIISIVGHVFNF